MCPTVRKGVPITGRPFLDFTRFRLNLIFAGRSEVVGRGCSIGARHDVTYSATDGAYPAQHEQCDSPKRDAAAIAGR